MGQLKAVTAAALAVLLWAACDSPSQQAYTSGDDAGVAPDREIEGSVVPARRGGAPAAWMPTASEMVIFGGMDPITNDTWRYDLEGRTWAQIPSN
jgi:hypothetical protein